MVVKDFWNERQNRETMLKEAQNEAKEGTSCLTNCLLPGHMLNELLLQLGKKPSSCETKSHSRTRRWISFKSMPTAFRSANRHS